MKNLKKNQIKRTNQISSELTEDSMSSFKRYALMTMALILGLGMALTSVGCGKSKNSTATAAGTNSGTTQPGGTACTNCNFTVQAGSVLAQHQNAEFKLNMLSDGSGTFGFKVQASGSVTTKSFGAIPDGVYTVKTVIQPGAVYDRYIGLNYKLGTLRCGDLSQIGDNLRITFSNGTTTFDVVFGVGACRGQNGSAYVDIGMFTSQKNRKAWDGSSFNMAMQGPVAFENLNGTAAVVGIIELN